MCFNAVYLFSILFRHQYLMTCCIFFLRTNSTLLQQEATIRVQGLPFSGYLEGLVFSSCTGNVDKVSNITSSIYNPTLFN